MLKQYSAKTHQGPYLEINEDDISVDVLNKLFLLFDGFGGTNIGDVTVKNLKNDITNFYSKVGGDHEATMPYFYDSKYLIETNALLNSILIAHKNLMLKNESLEMNQRGGSSLVGAVITENILSIVNIGNCFACLIRDSHLVPLISPDMMTPPWTTSYEAQFYSYPTNAIGLFSELSYSAREFRLCENDIILMMSDGLYSKVGEKDLLNLSVNSNLRDVEFLEKLFDLSNSRGNQDNQSGIIIRF